MFSVHRNKATAILGCLTVVFIYSCDGQSSSNLHKLASSINRLQKSANLGSDWSPTNYLCLFNNEECLAARSVYCHEPKPVCRGSCDMSERMRSFSPYDLCVDRDINRFPQNIVRARCLCDGCFDGTQESHRYFSEPIEVEMEVILLRGARNVNACRNGRRCRTKAIRLTVGCHCAVPQMTPESE